MPKQNTLTVQTRNHDKTYFRKFEKNNSATSKPSMLFSLHMIHTFEISLRF